MFAAKVPNSFTEDFGFPLECLLLKPTTGRSGSAGGHPLHLRVEPSDYHFTIEGRTRCAILGP